MVQERNDKLQKVRNCSRKHECSCFKMLSCHHCLMALIPICPLCRKANCYAAIMCFSSASSEQDAFLLKGHCNVYFANLGVNWCDPLYGSCKSQSKQRNIKKKKTLLEWGDDKKQDSKNWSSSLDLPLGFNPKVLKMNTNRKVLECKPQFLPDKVRKWKQNFPSSELFGMLQTENNVAKL